MKHKAMIKMAMLAAVMLSVNIANAALITGDMGITGSYSTSGGTGQANDTLLTLGSGTPGLPTSTGGNGDMGAFVTWGVTVGTVGDGNISLSSFTSVTDLYTIGGWQLDLATMAITDQTASLLTLEGTGLLSGNGFDATDVNWTFSANDIGSSYSMTITAVPVPAAVWLFGSGLLGLVGVARRKNS